MSSRSPQNAPGTPGPSEKSSMSRVRSDTHDGIFALRARSEAMEENISGRVRSATLRRSIGERWYMSARIAQEAYRRYVEAFGLSPEVIPAGGEHDANARPPPDEPEPDTTEEDPLVDQEVADPQPRTDRNSVLVPQSPPEVGEDPEDDGSESDDNEVPTTPEPLPRRTGRIKQPPRRWDPDFWKLD